MTPLLAGKDAVAGTARAGEYVRHRPEQTRLYQLVEAHYPAFVEHLAARERMLPAHVQREFEDYLKCGCWRRPKTEPPMRSAPSQN